MGIKYKEKVPQSRSSDFFSPCHIGQSLQGAACQLPYRRAAPQHQTTSARPGDSCATRSRRLSNVDKCAFRQGAAGKRGALRRSQDYITGSKRKNLRMQLNTSVSNMAFHNNGNRTHEKRISCFFLRGLSTVSHFPKNRPFWWSD